MLYDRCLFDQSNINQIIKMKVFFDDDPIFDQAND